tara:strand:+ start:20223 stop:20924 length:702 start_codon:yes stop_codon:yes gene_type:complete
MITLTTADALRAADVSRWQIVQTHRPQSVAEHTFGVITIALGLMDYMQKKTGIGFSPTQRHQVTMCAFEHDLPEVVTGDFPSPIKRIGAIGSALKEIESGIHFLSVEDRHYSAETLRLVKSADLIEAVLYLQSCAESPHAIGVLDDLRQRLHAHSLVAYEFYESICEEARNPMTMDKLADMMEEEQQEAEGMRVENDLRVVSDRPPCSRCSSLGPPPNDNFCKNACRYDGIPF